MPELTERKMLCRCGHGRDSHGYGIGDGACYDCNGDNHPFDGVPYVPCPECEGDGRVFKAMMNGVMADQWCPSCGGTGWVREEA